MLSCTERAPGKAPLCLCANPRFPVGLSFSRSAMGGCCTTLQGCTTLPWCVFCPSHTTSCLGRLSAPFPAVGGGGCEGTRGGGANAGDRTSSGKQQGLLAEAPAPTCEVTAAVQLLASLLGECAKPLRGQHCGMSVSIATSQRATFSEQFPYSAGFWT